jgi:glycosyltransferase involved in cell wall biosynthesis
MPTYRRAQQIGDSIASLLRGTYRDFELLIRDDGDGTDGTREAVLIAAKGDPRVRYHRNARNLRIPENLNSGIREAAGEYIAVCHDHDRYKRDFLARVVEALDRYPTALFVHAAHDVISPEGEFVKEHVWDWKELTPGHEWLRYMLSSMHCPVCALTLVRRSAHERFGLYDASFGFISDVEMWMRLSTHGDVAYVCRPIMEVRQAESDHAERARAIRLARTNAAIHRRYIHVAYSGAKAWTLRVRLEATLAEQVLLSAAWLAKRRLVRMLRPQLAQAAVGKPGAREQESAVGSQEQD